MAEEAPVSTVEPNAAAAPATSAPAAPSPASPAPAAAAPPPEPAKVETPAPVEPAKPVEAPAAEAKPEDGGGKVESKPETFLGEQPKAPESPTEPKVEQKAPEAQSDTPKEPEGQSADPASPPTYEAFTLPEGVSVDQERIGSFTGLLGEFETASKADHAAVQALGQNLVNMHLEGVQKAVTDLANSYKEAWDRQKAEWKNDFIKEAGNRLQTTLDEANYFIRTHVGPEEKQMAFRKLMEDSWLGNHPLMIEVLANAGRTMSEGKPLAATTPIRGPKSKTQTLYGKSS